MDNLYQQFKAVFPDAPLFVGTVQSVSGGVATVQLPDGGVLRAVAETQRVVKCRA